MDNRPCSRRRRRPTKAVTGPSRAAQRCAVTAALLSIGSLPLAVALDLPWVAREGTNDEGPSPCPDGPPPGGCQNGLFSPSRCQCDCIPGFCRDGSGACSATGECSPAIPWEDCVLFVDCPWWDNHARRAQSCITGRAVPPGVREISATREECCALHHPGSRVCGLETTSPPTPGPARGYETIPMRFMVVGLPAEVDEGALREEMLAVLRRVLTDAAEAQRDLRITNIEESPISYAGGVNGRGEREAHFDITVLRQRRENFGPVFVAWLKETYGDVVEYLEHYETMRYFGHGVDFYWCIDDGSGLQMSSLCSYEEEVVPVDFRLVHIPEDFDADDLAHQIKSLYGELLGGVERLDVLSIVPEVVNVTIAEGNAKDVFFNIHVLQKYGLPEFAPAIHDELKSRSSDVQVFDAIRSYADAQSLDLDWHVDSEGAYSALSAPAPREDPIPSPQWVAFPIWAIATMAAMGILCCCCCFCGIMFAWRIKRRDKIKNERNMVNHLHTGKAHAKLKSQRYPQKKQPLDLSYPSLQGPPSRHHKHHKHRRSNRHGGPRHESHKHKSHKHKSHKREKSYTHKSHRHERGRETALDGHRRRIKTYCKEVSYSDSRRFSSRTTPPRKDTEYELKNAKSFVFPGGNGDTPPLEEINERKEMSYSDSRRSSSRARPPRKDTEYELTNSMSFVFPGSNGDTPPLEEIDERKEVSYCDSRRSSSRARPPRKDTEYELTNSMSFVFPRSNGDTPSLEEINERKEASYSDSRRSSSRARPPRKDTECELKNAKSFVFPGSNGDTPPLEEIDEEKGHGRSRKGSNRQGSSRQGRSRPESNRPRRSSQGQGRGSRSHWVPQTDIEYQLEHTPTFAFGDDDGGGGNGDCPLPHLDLAGEEGYDDWDGDGDGDEYGGNGGETPRPDPDGVRRSGFKMRGGGTVDGGAEAGPPRKFVFHEVDSP